MNNIYHVLERHWGYRQFRPMQEDIIQSVLDGHDTLALLPTGGGKSLCFQVPAMAKDGLCLVISPLIALMKDQVENLRRKGITAFSITAENNRNEVRQILKTAGDSNCKFLYVSPERLQTALFEEYLFSLGISLIAVDEAHCISQWGYDFRPAYLKIAALREHLPNIPVIAVTASATPEVQTDICHKLLMNKPYIFRGSFLRPALSFRVFRNHSKTGKIIEILKQNDVSCVIYCRSRKKTQELADMLNLQGIRADYYHAGLSSEERSRKQEAWMKDETPVMVCTNAFGMGIDKPDVRMVIHHDMPDCLENYYQEAGRAGRDGQKAFAILLHHDKDDHILQELSDIRFPSPEFIREVFRHITGFLQIPAGYEGDDWMDFDIEIFTERFSLPVTATLYALQQLEQEGWISYAPKIALTSRIEFIVDRETLELFEEDHPDLEPVIKSLLRTYGGILDMAVAVSEYVIAKNLSLPKEIIIADLNRLHRFQIIRYQPPVNTPQIRFPEGRPLTDEWIIRPHELSLRKKRFEQRADAIIRYASDMQTCRSVMMAAYFGDTQAESCGICDNCLSVKRKDNIDFNSFQSIRLLLKDATRSGYVDIKSFVSSFSEEEKEKIMDVIKHLNEEEEISINHTGAFIFNI